MSEDLIKREDAIKAARSVTDSYVPFLSGINVTLPIECEIALRAVPSADRPQGEWKHDGSVWTYRFNCTNCGYHLLGKQTNFCPNCGARMKGADDE